MNAIVPSDKVHYGRDKFNRMFRINIAYWKLNKKVMYYYLSICMSRNTNFIMS